MKAPDDSEKTRDMLRHDNALLNNVIESLTHPFYVIDANDYTVILANSAVPHTGNKGAITCYALTHNRSLPCDDAEHPCTIKKIKETKEAVTLEHIHYDKNGHPRLVEVHGYPIFDSEGNIAQVIEYNIDITERKKAEEALHNSEKKFRSLFNQATDSIMLLSMTDEGAVISDCNEATLSAHGYTREELIGKPITLLDDPADAEKVPERIQELKNKGSCSFEIIHVRKDGTKFPVEVSAQIIKIAEVPLILTIDRDITQRKRLEEEKASLLNEFEEIIRIASHDLRSPLVNLVGYHKEISHSIRELNEILKEEDIRKENREKINSIIEKDICESVRFIKKSAAKMESLIAGLLSISRTGSANMVIEKIDMNKLADDVISTLEHQFKEQGASHEKSLLPSCRGDENMINQVLSNLIGNALKYLDPERPGLIKISGYKEDGNVVYCVEDNGIGIPPEEQKKVFEIFHQANPKSGGEGLGLNIVKKIVKRHYGKVWVESEFGKGSRFYVSLPG